MRVFVFGYDRFENMTTSLLLAGDCVEHTVLCHSDEDRAKFLAGGAVGGEVVATGLERGLAGQRNAALDMLGDGEWGVFLVDDLVSVSEVSGYDERRRTRTTELGINMDNQAAFKNGMESPISWDRFMVRCAETADACDAIGARLGGFCGIANPPWRDRKWKFNGLADGRAWVVKQEPGFRVEAGAGCIDDFGWTAQQIERHGVAVVNQWVLPTAQRYKPGGYGSIDDRLVEKLAAVKYLTARHPGLLRVAAKKNEPAGSHVQFRRTLSRGQLDRARRVLSSK